MNTQSTPPRTPATRPVLALPAQVCPVRRDHALPAQRDAGAGLAAAQSVCSDLRGLARQMCYATTYGVSV